MRLENAETRIFKAIVEENGFRRAAEKLHLSQSAVSQSLKQLEDKLGVELIQRGQPLTLTSAGQRYLQFAHAALREEESALEDIRRIREGSEEVLSVALNSTINLFYAPYLIPTYCQANPESKLKIEELPSRSIIYAVLSDRSELGMGPFQTHMNAYETIPLYREQRVLVASTNHPLYAQLQEDPVLALKQCALIASYLDDPELRPSMERIRDGFACVWEVSSLSLRLKIIAQGYGVSYVSEKTLASEPLCREFLRLDQLPFGSIDRVVGIYYKKGRELSRAAIDFIGLCKDFWSVDE